MDNNRKTPDDRSWEKIVLKYNRPDLRRSLWQIISSFVPYVFLWFLMVKSLSVSYWLTLPLIFLSALFLIRMFIVFHDCGHGSFFKSKKANDWVGKFIGIFTFTSYSHWTYSHRIHHATSGNLDKRGVGDVWTMTVKEYEESSKKDQFRYRLYRNPWFMFIIGSLYVVLFRNRITLKKMDRSEKRNILFTNLGLLVITVGMSLIIGLKAFLIIQLPVMLLAQIMGIFLFYVQHQFDDAYWDETQDWVYEKAAINGSSFLKLPAVLQWFTGNIGYHHIHHLSSRIPNYYLPRCHEENEYFRKVRPMFLKDTFRTLKLRLWDEDNRTMISFRQLNEIRTYSVIREKKFHLEAPRRAKATY